MIQKEDTELILFALSGLVVWAGIIIGIYELIKHFG
jgi:hypothetical protein